MACPRTIDQQLGVYDRTRVWMSLRLLHGLDVHEFLHGSRHAYHVVHSLLRGGEFDALEPLLQPACLEAVHGFAPHVATLPHHADDSISILSAVLTDARLLEPSAEECVVPGTAHLEVRFSALQGVTLHDLQSGATPLAAPRMQESTWTFEGVVRPPPADSGATEREHAADPTAAASDASTLGDEASPHDDWRVVNIEWSVWEVQEPRDKAPTPGWPTHGP